MRKKVCMQTPDPDISSLYDSSKSLSHLASKTNNLPVKRILLVEVSMLSTGIT